jgi:CheY-like chemotaxis protein
MDDMRITRPEEKIIVIVDDDPSDLELFMEALSVIYNKNLIKVFNDSQMAAKYFDEIIDVHSSAGKIPSFVLLDINMPKIDGFEILKKIKSSPKLKLIPVVMFSTSIRKLDVEKCYNLGANAYVTKPLQFAEFKERIKKIFSFWMECNETAV